MLFNSFDFAVFFALVFLAYWASADRIGWPARKGLLLVASLVFYASWNPPFVLLLLATAGFDYVAARRLAATDRLSVRRAWLVASLCSNLGVLAYFKYGEFLMRSGVALSLVSQVPAWMKATLPVGISFYVFQSLSYTIDVYRGRIRPAEGPLDFFTFVAFFPQLVAGPIVRATDFLPQLERARPYDARAATLGVFLVLRGLLKKVIGADLLGEFVDAVFGAPTDYGGATMLAAIYGYAFQIYFDFSGYSDIAIGTARILGFHLPDNFRLPYLAASPREFWQRWHISLSTWLRDYLYISLGGNRGPRWQVYRNLMITMALGGLWHGAAWTFVLWGIYHGLLLVTQRAWENWRGEAASPQGLRRAWHQFLTFQLVCAGWLLFRLHDIGDLAGVWQALRAWNGPLRLPVEVVGVLLIGVLSHAVGDRLDGAQRFARLMTPAQVAVVLAVAALMFTFAPGGQAFIYFQF